MCGSDLVLFWLCLASAVDSSSIITRSMIRMNEPPSSNSPSAVGEDSEPVLPEPVKLLREPEQDTFQIIYPIYREQQGKDRNAQSRSLESSKDGNDMQEDLLESKDKFNHNATKVNNISCIVEEAEERLTYPNSSDVLSSLELSRKYWEGYKNFSYDFFNSSAVLPEALSGHSSLEKGFQEWNIWGIFQKLYNCAWSSGFISCLQESFTASNPSEDYLQFMIPRFPKFEEDEGPAIYVNDKFDVTPDEEEGRKKISKLLHSVLPLLLMLKMSMLPALAVMALVSGKAFLLSLLSLGVALVAGSLPSLGALSASKRHEIPAPSSVVATPDYTHHPNKYYWM